MFDNAPSFPSLDRAAAYIRAAGFVRAPVGDGRLFWHGKDYATQEHAKGQGFWLSGMAYTGRAVSITNLGSSFDLYYMGAV